MDEQITVMDDTALLRGIAAPLARAQLKFTELTKGRKATITAGEGKRSYSYDYADIHDVLEAVRDALATEGIALMQPIDTTEGGVVVLRTLLVHENGLMSSYMALPVRGDPQAVGSAITYYRRYMLCAAVGIAAGDDDDGAAAKAANERDESRSTSSSNRSSNSGRSNSRASNSSAPTETPAVKQRREDLRAEIGEADAAVKTGMTAWLKDNQMVLTRAGATDAQLDAAVAEFMRLEHPAAE